MLNLDGTVAVITGASSGIGREFARLLAPRARRLILVARRRDRLEELKRELEAAAPGLSVQLEPCDLSDRNASSALVERLRQCGPIDVLINSAGSGDFGPYDRADWRRIEKMFDLNIVGLALLTHGLAGAMAERGRGGVLNVGSVFGMTYLPGFAAYVGTKYFVSGFTEALRADLQGTGVVVSQLCPGPVETEFQELAGGDFGIFNPPRFLIFPAEECARRALTAFERGRALIVPGILMKATLLLVTYVPRWITRLVLAPFGGLIRRRASALRSQNGSLPASGRP